MAVTDPGTVRDEAEQLVAAALAAASLAARGLTGSGGPHVATGSAECCVCPLCRTIAAVREPDPAFAERLASGAGELAAGVASFLRTVATAAKGPAGPTGDPAQRGTGRSDDPDQRGPGDPAQRGPGDSARRAGGDEADDDPWRAATRAAGPDPAPPPRPPRPMAKKTAKKTVKPPPINPDSAD